jgi:hypothetical protein
VPAANSAKIRVGHAVFFGFSRNFDFNVVFIPQPGNPFFKMLSRFAVGQIKKEKFLTCNVYIISNDITIKAD